MNDHLRGSALEGSASQVPIPSEGTLGVWRSLLIRIPAMRRRYVRGTS
jgi:hypothetical protein